MQIRPPEVAEALRLSNQTLHRVTHWREQAEHSEVRLDAWRKKQKLKADLAAQHHGAYFRISTEVAEPDIMAKLGGSAARIYMVLVARSHNTKRVTTIGVETMMKATGLSGSTIKKCYAQLKRLGMISRRQLPKGLFNKSGWGSFQTKILAPTQFTPSGG